MWFTLIKLNELFILSVKFFEVFCGDLVLILESVEVNLNIFGRGVKKFEVVEVFIGSVKFFEVLLWDLVFILESVDVNLKIFGRSIKKFEAVEIFRDLKYRV